MADEVLYEQLEDWIALVTLNRPEKRNAVNPELAQALDAAVKRSESDADVRVVILTSSNDKAFCAGADLKAVTEGKGPQLSTQDGGFAGFVNAKRKKPWIAAIRGSAVAGGMEISLACDMTVAADDAQFGLPEPKRGLLAAAGGLTRLPRAIPLRVATEMAATGDPVDVRRAYELGLVNKVVPAGQEVAGALDIARRIAANAPLAVQGAMELVRQGDRLNDDEANAKTEEIMDFLRQTEDWHEGPRAFVEKRLPKWTGR